LYETAGGQGFTGICPRCGNAFFKPHPEGRVCDRCGLFIPYEADSPFLE